MVDSMEIYKSFNINVGTVMKNPEKIYVKVCSLAS